MYMTCNYTKSNENLANFLQKTFKRHNFIIIENEAEFLSDNDKLINNIKI